MSIESSIIFKPSLKMLSKTMLSNFTNITAKFFFIAALFPFVSFGTNTMDSQPHYIVLALFSFTFFTFSGLIFRKAIDLIIFLMIILLTLVIFDTNYDFTFFRAIASYSGFIITLVVSIIFFERFGIPIKTIVIVNLIYIFAGLIQLNFGGYALDFLVLSNSADPSISGGVMSLTPEHTFFGIVLFFFSWILLIIYDYKPPIKIAFLVLINILSIFLLAKSAMVIVFLIVTAGFYSLRHLIIGRSLKKGLIIAIASFIFIYGFIMLFPGSRFAGMVDFDSQVHGGLIGKINEVMRTDGSVNDRVLNVVFPYFGIVINHGLPGGLHSFYDMSIILVEYFDGYFWAGLGSNKILSFIGSFIYELSVIGIIFILYMYWFLKDNNPNRFFELILLFVVLNSAIAVGFSLVPILMAIMYFKKSNPVLKSQNYDSPPDSEKKYQ
ncbi:hypothetical protein OAR79_03085 [Candidatus Thioglobus sp.]|nr:hypothetical protein [Candidatus Thioglobus sp.]